MSNQWKTKQSQELFQAFLQPQTEAEMAAFCRDLMTEGEIAEFAGRFQVAKELSAGKSQRQTSKATGVSIATVTRVNKWLQRGMNGYKTVLARLDHHHPR